MVVEFLGGYFSNSIAVMSDAAHLLSDLLSFFVGLFALKLANQGKFGIIRLKFKFYLRLPQNRGLGSLP